MSVLAREGFEAVGSKMKLTFLFVCCLAALVSARPKIAVIFDPPANYNSGGDLLSAPLTETSYSAPPSGSATVEVQNCCGGSISSGASGSSDSGSLGLSNSGGLGLGTGYTSGNTGSEIIGYSSGLSSSGGLSLNSDSGSLGYTSGSSSSAGLGQSSGSSSLGYTSGLSSSAGLGQSSGSGSLGYTSGLSSSAGLGQSSGSSSLGYTNGLSSSAGLGQSSGSSSLGYTSGLSGSGLSTGYTSDSTGGFGPSSGSGSLGYTSGASSSSTGGLAISSGSSNLGYNTGSNLALSDANSGFNSVALNTGSIQGITTATAGLRSDQTQQYAAQLAQQAPIITKNFYVHSAPEDHDDQQIVRYVTIGRPTKNYRVVFINAPSSTSTKAKIIANVAPTEDRTAIYVLTKKSNDLDISADVVTPAPTGPIKPDVFFIRYKTPQEAQHAKQIIQSQYAQLGGTTNVADEVIAPVQSVIGSLSQSSSSVNTVSTGNIQSSSQSQLVSQGSQDFLSTGVVPNQSQFNQVNGGTLLTNYPPTGCYRC